MSAAKHTPGPWTVDYTGCSDDADFNIETATIRAYSIVVAEVECHHESIASVEANTKLIAAAPDMANLLEEWRCFVLHGTSRRYSEREMLEWTAAVLAKAGL